jgi:hypothetical protein
LQGRGERRSPGQGRPPDAPTIEATVTLVYYENIIVNTLTYCGAQIYPDFLENKNLTAEHAEIAEIS